MKIALISTFLGEKWSGAEISSFLLAKNLKSKQDLFVITSKVKEKLPFRNYSLPLLKFVPKLVLLIGHRIIDRYIEKQLIQIFSKEKPDIVHIQDYAMMIAAVKAAKRLDIPTVMTVRSYQFVCNLSVCMEQNRIKRNCSKADYKKCLYETFRKTYSKGFLGFLLFPWFYSQNIRIRKWLRKIDSYVAVSEFVRKQLLKDSIKNVHTIMVQKQDWQPKGKGHPKRIFSAGGLRPSKGFDFLIRSFRYVVDRHPDAKLRIAGEGSSRKKLMDLVQSLNLAENVVFLGQVGREEIKQEYARSGIIVSPSLWPEPLTRIIFEAFSMKRPVIATDVGGSSELVKHLKTGMLVKPGDEQKMAASMIRLINDARLRNKLADRAFRLVKKECNADVNYKKHMKVYEKT